MALMRLNREKADPRFILYAFLSPQFQDVIRSRTKQGSTVTRILLTEFGDFPMAVPPIPQQHAIGEILGALDDRIDLLSASNKTCETIARTIFKSWFVDFDPVRAKAEGHEPEGMNADTAALFPSEFGESPIGLIPKGWNLRRLDAIATVTIGGIWGFDSQEHTNLIEAVCLRGVDLEHLRSTGRANAAPIRWVKPSALERRRLSDDEVLVGGSGAGPVGRPLHALRLFEELYKRPVVYSNFVKRLRCLDKYHAAYLDRILATMHQTGEIKDFINGTSVPNLNEKSLLATKTVCLPVPDVLRAYTELIEPFTAKLYDPITTTLANLRDTLLPRLISGKLRVAEAEKMVEAVL
jgi:type I restriction enzyme S subunit